MRMEIHNLESKLTFQTIMHFLESGITSQLPNPSAPSRVPPSQQQHQRQPQHSWQGWWRGDNWHNWTSRSQEKWSHQFEIDTGMFVSKLLLIFLQSSGKPLAYLVSLISCLSAKDANLDVPDVFRGISHCHSSATQAPRWDWHSRDTRGSRASPSVWVRRCRLQLRAARQTLTP